MKKPVSRRSLGKGADRLGFYAGNFGRYFVRRLGLGRRWCRDKALASLPESRREEALRRSAYYLRLPEEASLPAGKGVEVRDFKYPFGKKKKYATYFFDLFRVVAPFPGDCRFAYTFGDVSWETEIPEFVKTRPVAEGTTNSVLMPLNTVRHFRFVSDPVPFREKKDAIVFRNVVRGQAHRLAFLHRWAGHPMVDAGQVNTDWGEPERYLKPFMGIDAQLGYKFVACIEGNDVATNLKWVMSSNSVAVMPRPRFESWFMEGELIADHHYILVKDDYSDLEERLRHYIDHPEEAEAIIENAHRWVDRFRDRDFEITVARLTADRYFSLTNR